MRPPATPALLLAGVLALAVLAPLGGAQEEPAPAVPDDAARPTTEMTFYGHTFGWGRFTFEDGLPYGPMPANTEFPAGEDDFSIGTSGGCGIDVSGAYSAPDCDDWPLNELYYYSTAGFVDTCCWEDFSYTAIHNERGLTKDVLLDTTRDITTTFYMSADWHGWNTALCFLAPPLDQPPALPCWNWDPGVHPAWVVEATFFMAVLGEYGGEASTPPDVAAVIGNGDYTVIAQGRSAPADMVSLDESLPTGEGEVKEFVINLGKPQVDRIPKEASFVMKLEWWSEGPTGKFIAPNLNWNINGGEFYPNRFTLPVKNAFDVELVYPQFLHDKLLLHAIINTPWGSYDIDPASVTLELRDRNGGPVQPGTIEKLADYSVAHGGHYKPVNVTWVWDYQADKLRPSQYIAKVTARNHQGSAMSTTEAAFEILPDGSGRVLQLGRSGQQTISEAQLDRVTREAARLAGPVDPQDEALSPADAPAPEAPAKTPGFEALAALAILALIPFAFPRRP